MNTESSRIFKKRYTLKYKHNRDVYEEINSSAFSVTERPFGTSRTAVNKILSHPTFCRMVLPSKLGVSPNSMDWDKEVLNHVSSTQIFVSLKGYDLNLDYNLNLNNNVLKPNLDKFIEDNQLYNITKSEDGKNIKTVKTLDEINAAFISKIEPIDWIDYVVMMNVENYLIYILAYYSPSVANDVKDIDKSSNIRFYISDPVTAQKATIELSKIRASVNTSVTNLYNDTTKHNILKNIAIMSNLIPSSEIDIYSIDEIYALVYDASTKNPVEYKEYIDDKDLAIKSFITSAVDFGVITTNDSGYFISSKNPEVVIGETIEQAVAFCRDATNGGEVKRLRDSLNAISK